MGGAIFKGNALGMRLVNVMVLGDENRNRLYKMTTIVGSFRTRWVTTSVLFNTTASTSDKISYTRRMAWNYGGKPQTSQ